MWKPKSPSILKDWIETIEEEASDKLTSWETNFIDSLKMQINKGLTERQEIILERIYAEKTKL